MIESPVVITPNSNTSPGTHSVTRQRVQYIGPRPLRFTWPRNRAPTSGPVAPSVHSASSVSGLNRPVLVMSAISPHTSSGGASMCRVTESRMSAI